MARSMSAYSSADVGPDGFVSAGSGGMHPSLADYFTKYAAFVHATEDGQAVFACLGVGAWGVVIECAAKVPHGIDQLYALKIVQVDPTWADIPGAPSHLDTTIEREVSILMRLSAEIDADRPPAPVDSPYYGARHLVRIFDYYVHYDDDRGPGAATVYIVMERCPLSSPFPLSCEPTQILCAAPGSVNLLPRMAAADARRMRPPSGASAGDLFQYSGLVTKPGCKFVLKQLLVLLQYLHEPRECGSRILHRDLKLENTLVWQWDGEYPYIKVADFGCARIISDESAVITKCVGTPALMAPELFGEKRGIYDEKVDIFAVGCAFFVLLAGRQHLTPFDPSRAPLAFPELFNGSAEFAEHFTFGGMLNRYGQILSAMTHRDPAKRKSAKELLAEHGQWLERS